MADEDVRVERHGRVMRVTLNRPDKHNPLSRAVLGRLRAAFEGARDDDTIACAVVTGAGERYFAAGGDLRDLASVREEPDVRAMATEARAALDAVREFPVPVVALLNGDAIGGGAELALACDLRVLREGAHIGYIHGRLAITSAWGGGPDLVSVVGPARALRMTARCELVPAATALEWGLADAVASADKLDAALDEFIAPMLRQTRTALRGCKAQARSARSGRSHEERRALELDAFVATWAHDDHWTAVERILGRGKPETTPSGSR
ncbi:MAG TPA: enoyl-CoA hydratase/isomerase family protein [Usitatibacter sp.]|nr:enoyl-CoA hydratase/isomerase family protein [Usitatibacter sp.]